MNDLCWILSQLTDEKGRILIDGIDKMVAKLTPEEKQLYEKIDFDMVGLGFIFKGNLKNAENIHVGYWRREIDFGLPKGDLDASLA